MRIALIQFDPVVGDIHGNAARASKQVRVAAAEGANLIVFPELALCGYPPRDLLMRNGIGEACEAAANQVAQIAPQCAVILGLPRLVQGGRRPLANSLAVLEGGRITHRYDKRLLPNYDIFDEVRYFSPGRNAEVLSSAATAATRVGLLLCEDLWRAQDVDTHATYGVDPIGETLAASPNIIVVPSASPFQRGKHQRHIDILKATARRINVPIVSVNQLGGFDDLIFDGDVRVVWPDGTSVAGERWTDGGIIVEVPHGSARAAGSTSRDAIEKLEGINDFDDLWHALVCGTQGYLSRTGHSKAVVGLSGGIDSALVCTLAVAALGAESVTGVLMPSRWSSMGSVEDARELARRLGIRTLTLPIGESHTLLASAVGKELSKSGASAHDIAAHEIVAPHAAGLSPLADENIQSRLRGLQLMAISNSTGALVLTTGNKSEYAVGYTTLYGDMCGGLAPIGDVLKTDVWALAKWANANPARAGFAHPPIPQESIDKVPSAELRPNQTDQDTLPPYPHLDAIVHAWVEEELSVAEVVERTKLPAETVLHWTRAIDRAEYKRDQAPIILKVSSRAFGRGRRMPLAQQWRPS